jgi:hypothetical protein
MKRPKNKKQLSGTLKRNAAKMSHAELSETVLLQPWFLPQRIAFAMHSLVPVGFWLKMRHVFEDYGCLLCETDTDYHSNGMCGRCYQRTREKVIQSARRHAARGKNARLDLELFRQQNLAKKLLSAFAIKARSSQTERIRVVQHNPVYEALAARLEHDRRAM